MPFLANPSARNFKELLIPPTVLLPLRLVGPEPAIRITNFVSGVSL